jgi:hypothetical protein
MKRKFKPALNPNDIRVEMYNPNDFEIRFTRMDDYIPWLQKQGLSIGPAIVTCKPDGFCILDHQWYVMHGVPGKHSKIKPLIKNFGDAIGKGNKLPSAPEAWVKKHF